VDLDLAAQRAALRRRLRDARQAFASADEARQAQANLGRHLASLLRTLEPQGLGLYWPVLGEFNAVALWQGDEYLRAIPASLPFATRQPPAMHYRLWDGTPPSVRDECTIPTATGAPAQPDVVLVPCVGFTREGFRLGYGGGFFDRWLAAHPGVTSVGIAWAHALIDDAEFVVQAHDIPLTLIVTEEGVVVS
jgi:5,10-methenyltetrahydrofolate synthetase